MKEIWKHVPGWPMYLVSNLGRVKRERMRRPVTSPKGYLLVHMSEGARKKQARVHGLVMLAFEGPAPEGTEVCHLDGDRKNNRRENLAYETRKENHSHKKLHGTSQEGPRGTNSKLTIKAVREIRAAHATGARHWGQARLARKYGVNREAIREVAIGQTWRCV